MKPLGPIPPGYAVIDGQIAIGGETVTALVKRAGGTPLFVYSRQLLEQRIADLRAAMPKKLNINYAIKANPFGPVLEMMSGLIDGFDIASGGELAMVRQAGIDPARVSFAGPGKNDAELGAAIAAGVTLNIESAGEMRRALGIGQQTGVKPQLALRVNPDFELRGSGMKMGGGAKPFGIDQDQIPALAKELIAGGANWRGLHIFTGSQSLDSAAIIEAQANVLELANQLAQEIGEPLPKLNLGGGLGIPYFNGDKPVDLQTIGGALEAAFSDLPPALAQTEMCIELGRYLVGEAGVYLTTIVDRKVSHGETYLVTDGGLHHQLAASGNFGTVVRRNYPLAVATRYLADPEETVNVVGCLCTPLDRLADKVQLPRAEVGDLIAVFCAGAYGATASPAAFLGHGPALELLV